MKEIIRFLVEWVVSIFYLGFSLVLLGTIENGLFIALDHHSYLIWFFIIANLLIIYVVFRNWFAPRFNWLFRSNRKLSRQISLRLNFTAGLLLLIVFIIPFINP